MSVLHAAVHTVALRDAGQSTVSPPKIFQPGSGILHATVTSPRHVLVMKRSNSLTTQCIQVCIDHVQLGVPGVCQDREAVLGVGCGTQTIAATSWSGRM